MKIAIPIAEGSLCMHFGHCEQFAMLDVDETVKEIRNEELLTPPPHEPGLLPRWLAEKGATCIIAGGMGGRAKTLFDQAGIQVITGAMSKKPRELVMEFLEDKLVTGPNACDH